MTAQPQLQVTVGAIALVQLEPQAATLTITVGATPAIVSVVPVGNPGSAGPTGPAGAAGAAGPPGPSASIFAPAVFVGVAAGQTVALTAVPLSLQMLFANGLLQSPASYSVSGQTLTIPAGVVEDGDGCIFMYQTA